MRLVFVMATLVTLSACSTVSSRTEQPQQLYPYIGVQKANIQVARSWQDPIIPGEVIVWVLMDWPMTLVADTVLVPVDLIVMQSNQQSESP